MMWHGAQAGAFDLRAAVMEAMTAFRRAGESGATCFVFFPLVVRFDSANHAHILVGVVPQSEMRLFPAVCTALLPEPVRG